MRSGHDPAGAAGVRVYAHGSQARDLMVGLAEIGAHLKYERGFRTVFLQRGWLHGSHVDLVGRGDAGRAVPWREIADDVTAVADGLPDATRTEDDYLRAAAELGAMERVPPPYLPLHPHRTVHWLTGGEATPWPGELGALRESALARMFDPVRTAGSRAGRAEVTFTVTEAFAALADEHPWGIGFGSFSYRSHAEAFLYQHPELRARFAQRLTADRLTVARVVDAVLAGRESHLASRWRGAFAYCLGLFDGAGVTPEELAAVAPGQQPAADPADMSAFHAEVEATGITEQAGSWFTGFRLLLNLFYRQLPLLDISPVQRFYLCYALAEVTEELTGETWRDRLARVRPNGVA